MEPVAAVLVGGIGIRVAQVAEGVNALGRQALAHPVQEVVARVQPARAHELDEVSRGPEPLDEGTVGEVAEVHLVEHQILELGAVVAGRHHGGHDRARGRPGHAPGPVVLIAQFAVGTGQADALDAAALENEVGQPTLIHDIAEPIRRPSRHATPAAERPPVVRA
jgi:hypothetical protein